MKKVLIISYFYPPSLFVGGQRTEFWAKELHRFGYYPVIVTRNWNEGQTTITESVENNTLQIEKFETHEVHRIPFQQSLRDKIAEKGGMKLLQKALTIKELTFSNYTISALPYSNMFSYCDDLLSTEKIDVLIVSGRPFQSFQIGYKLKKRHDILWIPDYRDEWNSHYRSEISGSLMQFISKLERKSEKKWVSNADLFLSVSDIWVNRISNFNGIKGSVVKNGFESINTEHHRDPELLKIMYAGTLYPYQDLQTVIDSILELNTPDIQFHLIGGFDTPALKANYLALIKKYPNNFFFTEKVKKEVFQDLALGMDIGILTPYKNLDGCLPVKIFDYYANGLELLLCPSDNDLMENFILQTNSGKVVNSKNECKTYLKELLALKKSGKRLPERDYEQGKEFSRLYQTEVLAQILDRLQQVDSN